MASSPSSAPHPVDQVPPFGKLTILGIQHVLAFYAGAVVVPLVIVKQLGLDDETLIHLPYLVIPSERPSGPLSTGPEEDRKRLFPRHGGR